MPLNRIDGNLQVTGQLTAGMFSPPDGCIGDQHMDGGSPIETDKQRHLHTTCHGQVDGTAAFDEIRAVHVALSPGTVVQFQAGTRTANVGDSTITVDLKKNGVTILSDIIDLDSSIAAYDQVVAGINPSLEAYTVGDVFEVVVNATVGTGTLGQGLFAMVAFNEGVF